MQAGVDSSEAELIRLAENALYRLPGGIIARVSRPGQLDTARREVMVSQWLQLQDFPVVQAITDLPQPIEVAARAVTFWRELPPHTRASPREIGVVLRRLHAMCTQGIDLPPTDPFVQVETRIASLTFLSDEDRQWLLDRAAQLRHQYASHPANPVCLVHGDPWAGNIVRTEAGPVLLDLERFSFGPPEYDLVVIAASHTSYGLLPTDQYRELVSAYGRDVTTWEGYPLLRNIRELRVTTYAGQVALDHPEAVDQAVHRLRCLQGQHGDRPWPGWRAVP
ncbi:MAG TPA: aminoglycoside phosphotransferase family protein [Kineosporiaceae bacterium]|nr:aminoglycoside phosphotransferase family protein [Kineosporiaceae bacterium]